ncbi:MAG: hypothetical protein IPO48_09125 [Saprospiraceae bacterium]|nr:hypothetical protein [Saprospiraceae bacterium]
MSSHSIQWLPPNNDTIVGSNAEIFGQKLTLGFLFIGNGTPTQSLPKRNDLYIKNELLIFKTSYFSSIK